MKRLVVTPILISISLLLSIGLCAAATEWALLVGIDQYQSPGINPLRGAAKDAKGIAATLKRELGFPARHVLLYTSDSSAAYQPTTANIVKGLKYIAQKARPGDTIVMFFSGHGVMSGGQGYLLTYHSDLAAVEFTGLALVELSRLLESIRASHRLLLVDACRNDPAPGRGGRPNLMTDDFARGISVVPFLQTGARCQVAATIYSCEEGQRAYEVPDKERGFFSYYVEKGLKGEAADASGRVTLANLVSYLRREVPDQVQRTLGVDKLQVPWVRMEGEDPGSWVINRFKGARLAELQERMKAKRKELDRLAKLEAEARAAREREEAEIARREAEMAKLDAHIVEMRRRLGTPEARSSDSLDAMLAMVREKEEQQRRLAELMKLRQQEEAKRLAEIERLKAEKKEQLVSFLTKDIGKYEEIVASKFGADLKKEAWRSLTAKYQEAAKGLEIGDTRGLILRMTFPNLELSYTNSIGMNFVLIPAGKYIIGDDPNNKTSTCQREVKIKYPFYMQTTEVTQGQWKSIMKKNPSTDKHKKCGDECPVTPPFWSDCTKFISKLNSKENTSRYRLPTEAEWEVACRALSKSKYFFGNVPKMLGEYAWYSGNSDYKLHPVAQKKPNPWGLYDMYGNVEEWCSDFYVFLPCAGYPPNREYRVVRGGGYNQPAMQISSSNRCGVGGKCWAHGFRLVRDP